MVRFPSNSSSPKHMAHESSESDCAADLTSTKNGSMAARIRSGSLLAPEPKPDAS
eukprot:CAMPEP_0182846512 /NCGR_PEP_ID=MMETSP0006_2-20121128/27938_1 /TAXON_ID=97485 /ORGANISM="Prymnesium parvum, Strain Texoma1" /LENGTH=54 /DNA_ID=CAMNT_0024976731 /DNA_START=1174 /DNA_END=1338 /DNA_ORIENTATION=-